MKIRITVFFIILSIVLTVLCGVAAEENMIVRVLILENRRDFNVATKGPYKIYSLDTNNILMEGAHLRGRVTASKEGISIGDTMLKTTGFRLRTDKDTDIYVDNRRFRGEITIRRKDDLKLDIINDIDVEEYLYGVLYHEVSHRWPIEVLKAQAIAARTFAVYQKMQNKAQPYDLRSDIYSQVYGGKTSEKWAATRAVDNTKGKVLTYDGKIFPTYYHATCAGITEDASNLWKIDLPVLKGVKCPYCKHSPHYRWTAEIPLWNLANKLKEAGYKIGTIETVGVLSRNKSGRVEKVKIKDAEGVSVIMTAKDFRQMIGPNEVRSANFVPSLKWNTLVLKGLGWGHGVGLCQWGAFGMGRKGKKAEEILEYYYPGSKIATINETLRL